MASGAGISAIPQAIAAAPVPRYFDGSCAGGDAGAAGAAGGEPLD